MKDESGDRLFALLNVAFVVMLIVATWLATGCAVVLGENGRSHRRASDTCGDP